MYDANDVPDGKITEEEFDRQPQTFSYHDIVMNAFIRLTLRNGPFPWSTTGR